MRVEFLFRTEQDRQIGENFRLGDAQCSLCLWPHVFLRFRFAAIKFEQVVPSYHVSGLPWLPRLCCQRNVPWFHCSWVFAAISGISLGINRESTDEAVTQAFRKVAKKTHPDKGGSEARAKS